MDSKPEVLALNMLTFPDGKETEISVRKRENMVVQCCLCKRIRNQQNWIEEPVGGLESNEISHGYCPPCAAKAFSEIRAYAANRNPIQRKAAAL